MRYIIAVVFMLITITESSSQTYEVGPYLGGANYIGDVGSTRYINPSTPVFGGLFKWNRSSRHSFRFSIAYAKIEADDAEGADVRRKERDFNFENSILESSLGIEYTFWEFNLHKGEPQYTPYLYTGINYFRSNHLVVNDGQLEESSRNWDFAIPMTLGFKGNITRKLIGAVEIGARYTFTDNLDGSNPEEINGGMNYAAFGNQNTNDWYIFTAVSLTYTFGRIPCHCPF